MTATTITFGNFKGGVGKTTAATLISYLLQEDDKKVLLVDLDPQANATNFLSLTYDYDFSDFTTLFDAMKKKNLQEAIISFTDQLHLLPSAIDLSSFPQYLTTLNYKNGKENHFLNDLLSDMKDDYDYIIIDVPPTISPFTNNALIASDYAVIVMQTELDSLTGAMDFNDYIEMMQKSNPALSVLGILPYLEKKRSKIDKFIYDSAMSDEYQIKDFMLDSRIYDRERVKRFRVNGITDQDRHDKQTLSMYREVKNEILEKVGKHI